jgi:hypothetical protein
VRSFASGCGVLKRGRGFRTRARLAATGALRGEHSLTDRRALRREPKQRRRSMPDLRDARRLRRSDWLTGSAVPIDFAVNAANEFVAYNVQDGALLRNRQMLECTL